MITATMMKGLTYINLVIEKRKDFIRSIRILQTCGYAQGFMFNLLTFNQAQLFIKYDEFTKTSEQSCREYYINR